MSGLAGRLASFLLTPDSAVPVGHALGTALDLDDGAVGVEVTAIGSGRKGSMIAPAAAVLGDPRGAELAVDLAGALARRARVSTALTLVWGMPLPDPPRGQATRAAARLSVAVAREDEVQARAGGSGVVVRLPADLEATAAVCRARTAMVTADTAVVLALGGPRPAAFDVVLRGLGLVVAVVGGQAPSPLAALARDTLTRAAPDARVVSVVAPGAGLPRCWRHRAVIRQIVRALDG